MKGGIELKHFDVLPELVENELLKRGVMVEDLLYCVKADLDGEGCYNDVYVTFTKDYLYVISGNEEYKHVSGSQLMTQKLFSKKKHAPREMISFTVEDFKEFDIAAIKNMYIERHQNSAQLMISLLNEGETEDFEMKKPLPENQEDSTDSLDMSSGEPKGKHGGPPPFGRGRRFWGWGGSGYDKDRENILIARFSVGFAEKFEKFADRLNKIHRKEEIDDTLLEQVETNCPNCGQPYPDPNRPICPSCVDRRGTVSRLMGMFGEFKVAVLLIGLTIVMSNIFAVISPWFGSKLLYDDVLNPEGRYYGKVLMVVMIMLATDILGKITGLISGIITAKVVPTVTHNLRTKIYSSMQKLSLQFFTSKQTGSLMSRVDRDSNNVYNFFCDIVPYGIANVIKLAGVAGIMFYLSPILCIVIIGIITVIILLENYLYKTERKLYRKLDVAMRSLNSVLSDVMNGQRVVKSFAKEKKEKARYSAKNQTAYEINSRINDRITSTIPFMWCFYKIFSTGLFCFGCYLVIVVKEFEYGTLTALISYTNMIYDPIDFFMWIGDRWARCMDAASRMFEILDAKPTVCESDKPVHIENMKGEIEFKDVTFEYEAGRQILNHLSFKVEAGQMFGIVGKTGAGKSTIINLIARLYDVSGGEITIDGVPIKDIAFADLRRNIGIVSQETYLFVGTVAENIRYARPDATLEEIIEAAKSANAHEFITKLPDGYNTKIGAGGMSLSGGERQRLSIARAIIQDPNILILDEATASMDTRTERKIQAAIDGLKEGRTIISIAHRLSTLRDADMLCVIEHGELKEMGTHDALIRQKGKYFELYKLQADALKFIEMD